LVDKFIQFLCLFPDYPLIKISIQQANYPETKLTDDTLCNIASAGNTSAIKPLVLKNTYKILKKYIYLYQ